MSTKRSSVPVRNLVLVMIILCLARLIFALGPVEELVQKATKPLNQAFENLAYGISEPDAVTDQKSQVAKLENENANLRSQLGLSENQLSAEVIKLDLNGVRQSAIINKGEADGVSEGDALLRSGQLVGVVERTTRGTATIMLITDPEFRATAITTNEQGGVIKTENGSLIFDLAASNDISGQYISTDGIDGVFAPGIGIGELGERITDRDNTFHRYHVLLPRNLNTLDIVTVQKVVQ